MPGNRGLPRNASVLTAPQIAATFGARGMTSEELVDQLAAERGIDRLDLYSYDSGDFPKHILTEEVGPDDKNWYKP